jgi:hypothetical protein
MYSEVSGEVMIIKAGGLACVLEPLRQAVPNLFAE